MTRVSISPSGVPIERIRAWSAVMRPVSKSRRANLESVRSSPRARTTARSITFSSSRTLPGRMDELRSRSSAPRAASHARLLIFLAVEPEKNDRREAGCPRAARAAGSAVTAITFKPGKTSLRGSAPRRPRRGDLDSSPRRRAHVRANGVASRAARIHLLARREGASLAAPSARKLLRFHPRTECRPMLSARATILLSGGARERAPFS